LLDATIQSTLDSGKPNATVSIDRVSDYYNNGVLQLRAYEHFGRRMTFPLLLGNGIFAITEDAAIQMLKDSDFIVLTTAHGDRILVYPNNASIEKYWPELSAWTWANRVPIATEEVLGLPHT